MKILVAIPFLFGAAQSKETLDSVVSYCDVLPMLNGAEQSVRDVVLSYNFKNIIDNHCNIYVNPAWNFFMRFFLERDYDRLIIMNSDLKMAQGWHDVCVKRWEKNPDEILIPRIVDDKNLKPETTDVIDATEVTQGTPGVFITLNKKQVEEVYPIPDAIKVWFGDNWIFDILRTKYKTVIPDNLIAFHHWSTSVQRANVSELIEKDKVEWLNIQEEKKSRINKLT